ncbi:MAG: biotin/lipoyl-containing protein [Candidatus Eisenbacteria bacterium]
MRYFATVEDEKKEVEIEETESGFRIKMNGEWLRVDSAFVADGLFLSLLIEGESHVIETSRGDRGNHWNARVHGRYLDVTVRNELEERAAERREKERASGPSVLRSPMPGLVIKLAAAKGDEVKEGEPVAVVEAMKMQNELLADRDGRISAVHVAPGDRVDARAPIVTIETAPGEA